MQDRGRLLVEESEELMDEDKLKETAPAYKTKPFRSEFQPLIDQLYREEVLEARKMSFEEKFLAGEELFDYACAITLEGIKNQNPEFSEEDCRRELERRLKLQERMEQRERLERQR